MEKAAIADREPPVLQAPLQPCGQEAAGFTGFVAAMRPSGSGAGWAARGQAVRPGLG